MYPIRSRSLPWSTGQYLPYFYHAGLHRHYDLRLEGAPASPASPTYSRYDFSSDYPRPSHAQPPQTVEQIVQSGYFAVPAADPVTAILSDKQHTARFALGDLISQIRQRHAIYEQNIYELNQAACEVQNGLFRQLADHGTLVANQRQQYSVTKQIQKLYEQQRQERTDLWRDVSRLRLALPETAQQYLSAYRKVSALESFGEPFGGDEP